MGVFWNAAVFKKQDTIDIYKVIEKLAREEKKFELIPEECSFYDCEGGMAVVFNDHSIAFDDMAKALSQSLEGPVLVGNIYDGDYWDYWLYKEGRELSRFMTIPDYFEEMDAKEMESWCGNAELLGAEFGCPAEALAPYLCFWEESMERDPWEVLDFLKELGFLLEEDGEQAAESENDLEETQTDEPGYVPFPEAVCYTGRPPILPPYQHDDKRKLPEGKDTVDLRADVRIDPETVGWVRVRGAAGEEQVFSGSMLTSERIVQLMDQTLNGDYTYLALDFLFQGEGIYVKQLKKKVYRPYHSTLVVHRGVENMACLFFAGNQMCCYELIGNFYAYYNISMDKLRQVPVGGALLSENLVFTERSGIDKALYLLFTDLENADSWMKDSPYWSARNVFPGGVNNYNRLRRNLGLLED